MNVSGEIVINKPVQDVWEIVGNQFGEAYRWGSVLKHTKTHGRQLHGVVCDMRTCDIAGIGTIKEKILEFDPQRHVLAYEVVEGFPFFVKRGVNQWRLIAEGSSTRLTINAEIETSGIVGLLMAPMMKMQMSSIMKKTREDLKYYVENGKPHPRKVKAA